MLGEMDYSDVLTSNVVGDVKVPGTNILYVPLPELSYVMFVLFVLAVSIVLMNLLVSDVCVNGTRYTDGIVVFVFIKGVIRLSREKVLGTVMQYSLFSVISGCLYNTVHPFRNFLAGLPPPTLYNFETRKKQFWIHASNVVYGVGQGVRHMLIEKKRHKCKDFCHNCSF